MLKKNKMARFLGADFVVVLRGLNAVSRAVANVTEAELKEAWAFSSSSRPQFQNLCVKSYKPEDIAKNVKDAAERSFAVVEGLKQYSSIAAQRLIKPNFEPSVQLNEKEFLYPIPNQGMVMHACMIWFIAQMLI